MWSASFRVFLFLVLMASAARSEPATVEFGLFPGQGARISLSIPERAKQPDRADFLAIPGTGVAGLLALIGAAEAGRLDYDAIHLSARRLPRKRPTDMSVGEVLDWIDATPGQSHAIGRYQFIPMTLRRLLHLENVHGSTRFSPALQDRLALRLLAEAGLSEFQAGALPRERFLDALALIWAGLPLANGKSAYHGYAGNRATISRHVFDARVAALFQ